MQVSLLYHHFITPLKKNSLLVIHATCCLSSSLESMYFWSLSLLRGSQNSCPHCFPTNIILKMSNIKSTQPPTPLLHLHCQAVGEHHTKVGIPATGSVWSSWHLVSFYFFGVSVSPPFLHPPSWFPSPSPLAPHTHTVDFQCPQGYFPCLLPKRCGN